eukprot:GILI01015399.1.p1 GENE.GILI01015399.1~~GILI01015399.1.p1  ORF type:complete len:214 (+),score=20.48 GILI01015399.1:96-737(+)
MSILSRFPIINATLISSGLFFSGDVLCQFIEHKQKKDEKFNWEHPRSLKMGLYGLTVAGPVFHLWYTRALPYLCNRLPTPFHSSKIRLSLSKLVLDEVFFSPSVIVAFFSVMGYLEGHTVEEVKQKLRKEFVQTYLLDAAVWPPIQLVNFRYVPIMHQATVVNSCNVFWNAYLSYAQHSHVDLVGYLKKLSGKFSPSSQPPSAQLPSSESKSH